MAQDTGGGGGAAQPKYTMAEYNAYQACAAEKNPAAQIKCLDDFVAKYPTSALLNYIYPLYYKNYGAQKNFPKTIEYCDKLIALGDKASVSEKYEALSIRAASPTTIFPDPDAPTANAAHDAALAGAKIVDIVPMPEGVDDGKFAAEKQKSIIFFLGQRPMPPWPERIARAPWILQTVLAVTPDDLTANYNLGKAYSCTTPPQQLDSLWAYARAATSKNANEQQSKKVKTYLRKLSQTSRVGRYAIL